MYKSRLSIIRLRKISLKPKQPLDCLRPKDTISCDSKNLVNFGRKRFQEASAHKLINKICLIFTERGSRNDQKQIPPKIFLF